ncbi:MAG TPA: anaerobic ribonucleoside-triphosphate reductase activating protein [Candidatus Woesebacteria bacterium]|nr:anaerobic ribonucleoside-triphosphate reductase activating protein [Candidatus Woesebacteria bacterium]HRT40341.1 anaerobic ribonucleoside-triphosphate reductase activating protein [Candidatus Woesebacteria bacterium]
MRLGGCQQTTFLDYPGKLATTIFTVGCNFRCPFCHNRDLVLEAKEVISEEDFFEFLKKRKNILEGVVISGGEPTLQPGLDNFCSKIKQIGYLVKLDTNGSRPEVLEKLIKNHLIDFVAMDIKADRKNYEKASGVKVDLAQIEKSVEIIKKSGLDHQFRSTIVRGIHDKKVVARMKKKFPNLVLQKFRAQNCLNPAYLAVEEWTEAEWYEFA